MEKLADVTNYCLQMAQVLVVDIIDVVNCKMDIMAVICSKLDYAIDDVENGRVISEEEL